MAAELEVSKNSVMALQEELQSRKATLKAEITVCKLDAANQYGNGLNAALDQIHIITFEVDTSEAYVWKEIINGKLVSPPREERNTVTENAAEATVGSDGNVEDNVP